MAENSYEMVIVARAGAVVRVTLNRPEKKNPVDATIWNELYAVLAEVAAGHDRVLVLTGAGGAVCSGADRSGGRGDEHPRAIMDHIGDMALALALHRLASPRLASPSQPSPLSTVTRWAPDAT